jgi:hypothetical protein
LPASLRSDGVRDHPGMPFGFLSETAFAFGGIPISFRNPVRMLRRRRSTSKNDSIDSAF